MKLTLENFFKFPAFLPGQNQKPDEIKISASPLTAENCTSHFAFQIGLELFRHEYFWEAHEVWEPSWKLSKGLEREFLQALIKFSAANLKSKLNQPDEAERLKNDAHQVLQKLISQSPTYCGINLKKLMEQNKI